MANPPITIGPFTNVPAPGSPIASAWPQTISQWITDRQMAQATVTLSLPLSTADTTGVWITGNYPVPTKPFKRIAMVSATINLTATADVDLQLLGTGSVIYRRTRRQATAGANGANLHLFTAVPIAAGAAETFAFKLAALSGTVQVQLIGGAEWNYLDVLTFPIYP